MNLTLRRTLYLSFFAVFIIVAAPLLFYLQGYRYNQDKGRIERTGALVVESIPDGATVAVNGTAQDDPTPLALQSLPDGDYDVRISRGGFQAWHKSLGVKPSRVTFTGQVRLWPQAAPGEPVAHTGPASSTVSPNGDYVAYWSSQGLAAGLWLMNLTTGIPELLARPAVGESTSLRWSPSGRAILMQQVSGAVSTFTIYNLEDKTWDTVNAPASGGAHLARWGRNDQVLYLASGDELYEYSRRDQSLQPLWQEQLQDFTWHDGLIFGLTSEQDGLLHLAIFNPATLALVPLEQPPQLVASASFLPTPGRWLPLLDNDRHMLYLLHSPLTELVPVRQLPDVLSIDWSPDGEQLLLTNNVEIWQYQVADDKLTLLERVATPLTRSLFFGPEPYLITASGKEVGALELDDRGGGRQRWVLASYSNPVTNIFLDHDQRTLTVQTDTGFWRLTLRREPASVLSNLKL